jgi:transcription initiation factor IIE alpha subunit
MSKETGYIVHYDCSDCDVSWTQQWSCACDDECPSCGTSIEASDYELDGTRSQEELDAYNSTSIS